MHLSPDTLSKKIKKSFGLWSSKSKVGTLTPADTSGLTVQSTDAETHKIDDSTVKLFSMVQAIRLKRKTYLKVLTYHQYVSIKFDLTFHLRLK